MTRDGKKHGIADSQRTQKLDPLAEFGHKILYPARKYRRHLSQKAIAEKIGVDQSTISRYERNGEKPKTLQRTEKVIDIYGIQSDREKYLNLLYGLPVKVSPFNQEKILSVSISKNKKSDKRVTKTEWEDFNISEFIENSNKYLQTAIESRFEGNPRTSISILNVLIPSINSRLSTDVLKPLKVKEIKKIYVDSLIERMVSNTEFQNRNMLPRCIQKDYMDARSTSIQIGDQLGEAQIYFCIAGGNYIAKNSSLSLNYAKRSYFTMFRPKITWENLKVLMLDSAYLGNKDQFLEYERLAIDVIDKGKAGDEFNCVSLLEASARGRALLGLPSNERFNEIDKNLKRGIESGHDRKIRFIQKYRGHLVAMHEYSKQGIKYDRDQAIEMANNALLLSNAINYDRYKSEINELAKKLNIEKSLDIAHL